MWRPFSPSSTPFRGPKPWRSARVRGSSSCRGYGCAASPALALTSAMLRTRWKIIRLIAFGSVAGITGLGLRAQAPVDLKSRDSLVVARDISGTWEGTFGLDSTWKLAERPSARTVPARLHFNPVGD